VRAAAVEALASDPESKPLLRDALHDARWNVRTAAVEALASDPESKPLLRDALRDPHNDVRAAATTALQPDVPQPGIPFTTLAPFRPALRLVGHDLRPASPTTPEATAVKERLGQFVQAPRPLRLDQDPALAELLLGWLCVRLAQTTGVTFRVFGELRRPLPSLLDAPEPIVLRISMSAEYLPIERSVYPLHNLIETWRVARHLQTDRNISIWLACADLHFDDLIPPELDQPGKLYWRAPFFGFRLPAPGTATVDPWIELLTSSSADRRWAALPDPDRGALLQTLGFLAQDPDTDPWSLVPLLGRIGHALPPGLRASLAERLPDATSEAVAHLDRARVALGVAHRGQPAAPPPSTTALTPAARLDHLCSRIDLALAATPPDLAAAAGGIEEVVAVASADTPPADLDRVVRTLDRVRDRTLVPDLTRRLLALTPKLAALPLPERARDRLDDIEARLHLSLKPVR